MTEKGVTIDGFENYQVSNFGRIKRVAHYTRTNRYYEEKIYDKFSKSGNKNNYYYTRLIDSNGKQKTFSIHRLVAIYFVPNPDNKPEVDHIDRNPLNNRADNLRWVTRSDNMHNIKRVGSYTHTQEFYDNHPNYGKPREKVSNLIDGKHTQRFYDTHPNYVEPKKEPSSVEEFLKTTKGLSKNKINKKLDRLLRNAIFYQSDKNL